MNDWNDLHLRRWKPRGPSSNLKDRIFRAPAPAISAEPEAEIASWPTWQWWAPATALVIAVLTVVSGQLTVSNLAQPSVSELMTSAVLKEPSLVAYLPAAGHTEANAWPITSFEWTNRGYLGMRTNGMMP